MKPTKRKARKTGLLLPFSRDVLRGSAQLTVIWYIAAGVLHRFAAYTPDYLLTLSYRDALLETAPVTLAAGIIAALICDLALRRAGGDSEK